MIQPIITANQAIANKTMVAAPYFKGKIKDTEGAEQAPPVCPAGAEGCASPISTDSATKGEKLDINFTGCRIHTLNGNKVNYLA